MKYQVTYQRKTSHSYVWHNLLSADFTNIRGAMMFIDFLEDQHDVIGNSISLYEYETGYQLSHEDMR